MSGRPMSAGPVLAAADRKVAARLRLVGQALQAPAAAGRKPLRALRWKLLVGARDIDRQASPG